MKLFNWIKRLFKRRHVRTARANTDAEAAVRLKRQLHTLASMPAEHPVWQTILQIVDEHEWNMADMAIAENLTNEQRQYAAGKVAGARYLANALRDLKERADKELAKKQQAQ